MIQGHLSHYSFFGGCACFSHTVSSLRKLKLWTSILSFVVQAVVVLLVGGFVPAEVVEGRLRKMIEEVD